MNDEQIQLSTTEKHGFLECELYKGNMHFKFIDTDGKVYVEKNNIIRRSKENKTKRRILLKRKSKSTLKKTSKRSSSA